MGAFETVTSPAGNPKRGGMFEMQKAEGQEDVPRKRWYQMLEHPQN